MKKDGKAPTSSIEERLMKKENWKLAREFELYWSEDDCVCDICNAKISGRHMIDGIVYNSFEFALMCPFCHYTKGDGFGEGKGQLYTKTNDNQWLLTYGFPSNDNNEDTGW